MEHLLTTMGLSFTASKIIPFVLFLLLGIILFIFSRKKIKKAVIKNIVSILLLIAPVATYFAFNPIFQGDLNNTSSTVPLLKEYNEINENTLYVISLPGCPWCKLSIKDLEKIKAHNPALDVTYLVTSTDSIHLKFYKDEMPENFNLKLAENPEAMADLAAHSFPTFVVKNKEGKLLVWNNSAFGANAFDQILRTLR